MPPKKGSKARTYEVRSANTGALVCGPYKNKKDADREARRLQKEADSGKNAAGEILNAAQVWRCPKDQGHPVPSERNPFAVVCSECGSSDFVIESEYAVPIKQTGHAQAFEVVTSSGLVVG